MDAREGRMPADGVNGRGAEAAGAGPGRSSWAALGLALGAYALLWLGPLAGFGLIDPLQPVWHAAVIALGLLLMGQVLSRAVPKGWAVLKILLGVGVFLSVLLYGLGLLMMPRATAETGVRAEPGPGLSYAAVREGGMGSTWTRLVERRTYAGVIVRERTIGQYEREQVLRIEASEPGTLRVHLQAYGQPVRVVELPAG